MAEPTLSQDLYNLLKIVATSKHGVMNLGTGEELSRLEQALADFDTLEAIADCSRRALASHQFEKLEDAKRYLWTLDESKKKVKTDMEQKLAGNYLQEMTREEAREILKSANSERWGMVPIMHIDRAIETLASLPTALSAVESAESFARRLGGPEFEWSILPAIKAIEEDRATVANSILEMIELKADSLANRSPEHPETAEKFSLVATWLRAELKELKKG